jgi:hypothetical protein
MSDADIDRCVQLAADTVLARTWAPLPCQLGFTGLALGGGGTSILDADDQAYLAPPMPVSRVAALPGIASRRPKGVAYHPMSIRKRRRITDAVVDAVRDDRRSLVLNKWLAIVEVNLGASQLGTAILASQEDDNAELVLSETIADVFAAKAVNTLEVRASAMLLYVKWHSQSAESGEPALQY